MPLFLEPGQKYPIVLDIDADKPKATQPMTGVVISWSNMGGGEFSAEALHDVLSYQEARELLRKVMYNQHITADEKKSIELLP